MHVGAISAIADGMSAKSLACVDAIGGALCSVALPPSHVEAASVVDLVGVRQLDAMSLVVLDAELVAARSSVALLVSHAEAAWAVAAVLILFEPSACSVARL